MPPEHFKLILRWALIGAASAILAGICLLGAIPAFPGAAIGGFLAGEPVVTDHGADLRILVPANSVFYAYAGLILGIYLTRRRKRMRREPRCCKCDYSVIGKQVRRLPGMWRAG